MKKTSKLRRIASAESDLLQILTELQKEFETLDAWMVDYKNFTATLNSFKDYLNQSA